MLASVCSLNSCISFLLVLTMTFTGQWELDDWNLIPGIYITVDGPTPQGCLMTSKCVPWHMCQPLASYTHTQIISNYLWQSPTFLHDKGQNPLCKSLRNTLCRPGWPQIQRPACHCPPSTGIKGVHYYAWLGTSFSERMNIASLLLWVAKITEMVKEDLRNWKEWSRSLGQWLLCFVLKNA